MEERKVWTMDEVSGYFLYVNEYKVPEVFMTLEAAQEAAHPHLKSLAALKIKTTSGAVRTWNYRYDLKQWVEMIGRVS